MTEEKKNAAAKKKAGGFFGNGRNTATDDEDGLSKDAVLAAITGQVDIMQSLFKPADEDFRVSVRAKSQQIWGLV